MANFSLIHPSVIQSLIQLSLAVVTKELKEFILFICKLYFRGGDGVFALAWSTTEAKEYLQCIHDLLCMIVIRVFIDACRGRVNGVRWQRRLLTYKEIMQGAGNPSI